jgi:anti-sigma-K factor RskA
VFVIMTDLTDKDEQSLRAAEYALGLLTPAETDAFEQQLAVDPELRSAYALWAEDFAATTDGVAPANPPAGLRRRIEAEIFPEPAATSAGKPSLLQRLGLLPAMLTGLVAALAVLVVVDFGVLGPKPPSGTYGAEIAAGDRSLVVTATYDPDAAVLRINRVAGQGRDGRVLELWLIAGGKPPVSLGVMPDSATAALPIPETLVAALKDGVLAISDEPPGGSPTGQPTGDVLATGPVTLL